MAAAAGTKARRWQIPIDLWPPKPSHPVGAPPAPKARRRRRPDGVNPPRADHRRTICERWTVERPEQFACRPSHSSFLHRGDLWPVTARKSSGRGRTPRERGRQDGWLVVAAGPYYSGQPSQAQRVGRNRRRMLAQERAPESSGRRSRRRTRTPTSSAGSAAHDGSASTGY
jgi:hypothetical protein